MYEQHQHHQDDNQTAHFHHHLHLDSGLVDLLRWMAEAQFSQSQRLVKVEQKVEALMARSAAMTEFLARLNQVTNDLAERVKKLIENSTRTDMTQEEEDAAIAEANAVVATLTGIGASPTEPLPGTPTPPELRP